MLLLQPLLIFNGDTDVTTISSHNMPQAGQVTVLLIVGAGGDFITCNFATGRRIKAGKL
jgi:hypothetical protein